MRLIDADILIAELKESALHHCNNPREDSLLQRDRVIVRAQPPVEAIPIPKGVTNGDILEMIFPQMKVEKMGTLVELVENGVPKIGLNDDFWNARYTEGFLRKELEK